MTHENLKQLISEAGIKAIDEEIEHYPADERQSVVMRALTIVQEELNHLTPQLMDAVAAYLDMSSIAVYEVATFYSLYEHQAVGKHIISVCRSISCHLRGADNIIKQLEQQLGVSCGQTSQNQRFTLKQVECLGACVDAPMMQIDKDYHKCLRADSLSEILETYN